MLRPPADLVSTRTSPFRTSFTAASTSETRLFQNAGNSLDPACASTSRVGTNAGATRSNQATEIKRTNHERPCELCSRAAVEFCIAHLMYSWLPRQGTGSYQQEPCLG